MLQRDIFTFHARTACQTHDVSTSSATQTSGETSGANDKCAAVRNQAMGCDCLDPESLSRRPESPSKSNAELLKDLEDSDGDVDQPYISTASNVRPEKKNQSRVSVARVTSEPSVRSRGFDVKPFSGIGTSRPPWLLSRSGRTSSASSTGPQRASKTTSFATASPRPSLLPRQQIPSLPRTPSPHPRRHLCPRSTATTTSRTQTRLKAWSQMRTRSSRTLS